MKYPVVLRRSPLVAGCLFTCAAVFSASIYARQVEGLKIKNRTQAFQVAAVEQTETGDLKLSLRNDSAKYITAFRLSVNGGRTHGQIDADIVCCNRGIAPGVIHPIYFGARAGGDSDQTPKVIIEAVVFDDLTSDGDSTVAAEILAARSGEKLQLTRIVDLIEEALNEPDAGGPSTLDVFKSHVSALPVEDAVPEALARIKSEARSVSDDLDQELSRGVQAGLRNGKERVRQSLLQLQREQETSGVMPSERETLSRIKQDYERIIARL